MQGALSIIALALAVGLYLREEIVRIAAVRLAGLYAAVLVLKIAFPLFLMNAVFSTLPSGPHLPRAIWSWIAVQLTVCFVMAMYLSSVDVCHVYSRDRTLAAFDPAKDPMPAPRVSRNYIDGV
jgi:Na+/glutamate symporter